MERVLLQLKNKTDRRRIEDWLAQSSQIVLPDPEKPLAGEFDLVVIDNTSLTMFRHEVKACREKEEPVFLPFLLVTRRRNSNVPVRHLGRLVDDLLFRPLNQKELQARVANLLRMRRWSVDLKKEHDRAMKLAVTDDVSGYNNTRYLHRFLDRLLENPAGPVEVCLVFFDLDNFKALVDEHGHLLGSKALREVAQAAAKVLAEDDRLVRYGGDEFIAVLPRQNKDEALLKVARMRQAIEGGSFLQKEGINARLTASFGLASFPEDAANKRELLAAADRCLFRSKTAGKNRITISELETAAA